MQQRIDPITARVLLRLRQTMPAGTAALWVAPWGPSEVYAVAARWSDAAAPIYSWGDGQWIATGRQVADFCHSAREALRREIEQSIVLSGDEPEEDAVEAIMADAEYL